MTERERKDNSGALFKAKANENPRWPGYEGSCTIAGVDYWISAWVKDGKAGKFFSLAFKPKEPPAEKPAPTKPVPSDDEDIPFILNECHYEVAPRLERRLRRV